MDIELFKCYKEESITDPGDVYFIFPINNVQWIGDADALYYVTKQSGAIKVGRGYFNMTYKMKTNMDLSNVPKECRKYFITGIFQKRYSRTIKYGKRK
jgi:hypothetical protein